MKYYSEHAEEYIEQTIHGDMSDKYQMVEKYLHKGDRVLDVGFGSGRDMIYFKSKGYEVEGVDSEIKFVEHAKSIGLDAYVGDARYYEPAHRFNLIWCCASLIHLKREEVIPTIKRLMSFLEKDGILFLSMKYSDQPDGEDDKGRYFTYVDDAFLDEINDLILDKQINQDGFGRDVKWMSVVLKLKWTLLGE